MFVELNERGSLANRTGDSFAPGARRTAVAQQPIIKENIDTLFEKLRNASQDDTETVNVEKWFNVTEFDVIGNLAFGEPFGYLEDSTYHPWVHVIFKRI
ncbi:cytochrome P450 [Colletotrichum orchidophilum]|uniref:Cytochrome P450 n=1 Tax=Colletotrichum orchidophilum TaxID=1209926 RepID=A0A1G4B3B9_9PEZI|nr:cytochrome P450 [Colletotrichum orchidophilum]OHE95833.1 cytochrome P450 [Colletotrichum orchidophilum]